jgi:hypothetical protein
MSSRSDGKTAKCYTAGTHEGAPVRLWYLHKKPMINSTLNGS